MPLPKVKKPSTLSDLRPISLTNIIAKILERIVLLRIRPLLESVVGRDQHAYRSRMSTTTALLEMTHRWLSFLDKHPGSAIRVGLLDFAKAFDSVNPGLLVGKLASYDFPPWVVSWVWSFLSNRRQSVLLEGKHSSMELCRRGIPQGTVLGPSLFCVMLNDLEVGSSSSFITRFADDQTLSTFVERGSTGNIFCSELQNVALWCHVNEMTINAKKTKEIVISLSEKSRRTVLPLAVIDGSPIEQVKQGKILGLTLDEHLTWNHHVDSTLSKCRSNIFLIRRLKSACRLDTRTVMYLIQSLILPVLGYAYPAWCNIGASRRADMARLLRKSLSLAGARGQDEHALLSTHLDGIIAKLYDKIKEPSHPLNYIIPESRPRTHTTRRNSTEHIKARTEKFSSHFIAKAIRISNSK